MAYEFHGFFASWADGLMEAAVERWPEAVVMRIEQPFVGVGVRSPEDDELEYDAGDEDDDPYGRLLEELQGRLPAFSREFPGTTFVYVHAECFGGPCDHEGFVCRNGEVVLRLTFAEDGELPDALHRLLAPLGVELDATGYFEPFTRGYFRDA